MATWFARILGHPYELEDLPLWLEGSDLQCLVEGEARYLCSPSFEVLNDGDAIRNSALQTLELVNGLVRLIDYEAEPLTLSHVEHRDGSGAVHAFALHESRMKARGKVKAEIRAPDGALYPDPAAGLLTRLLQPSVASAQIQSAISFINRTEVTWNDLYRALEVVEGDVGGTMVASGWISDIQKTRFERTANSYATLGIDARHGRDRQPPPPDPMPYEVAKQLVLRAISGWILSKSSGS